MLVSEPSIIRAVELNQDHFESLLQSRGKFTANEAINDTVEGENRRRSNSTNPKFRYGIDGYLSEKEVTMALLLVKGYCILKIEAAKSPTQVLLIPVLSNPQPA
jgi:hypothetical protein